MSIAKLVQRTAMLLVVIAVPGCGDGSGGAATKPDFAAEACRMATLDYDNPSDRQTMKQWAAAGLRGEKAQEGISEELNAAGTTLALAITSFQRKPSAAPTRQDAEVIAVLQQKLRAACE